MLTSSKTRDNSAAAGEPKGFLAELWDAVSALLPAAYRGQTCLLRNIAGAIAALVGLPLFALIPVNLHGQRQSAGQRPVASTRVAGFPVPYWRELLSARWQAELTAVTELSLAFHETAEVAAAGASPASLRRLQRRTVAARRALADLEEALARLSAGHYGRCEQCGGGIPAGWLLRQPEVRYCPGCLPGAPTALTVTMSAAFRNLLALVLAPALNRACPAAVAPPACPAAARARLPAAGCGWRRPRAARARSRKEHE